MPSIIDIAQSTFIPGRSISDNILLAQELFRGYDRDTGSSKCALKIDLHKAFDSINLDFIIATLVRLHFPDIVIKWIKACLCTTRFSVKLNGVIHGILNKVPQGFIYHWCCKEMGLTHLFFADDVIFFSHGSQESVMHIMDSIAKFSSWSGLSPSIHKINSFMCNCDHDFTVWFDSLLIPRGTLPVRFLGVPLITTQLCVNDWAVHATIQFLLTRFLWHGNINHKGGAKVAWQTVCLPREEGGLGLKNMLEESTSRKPSSLPIVPGFGRKFSSFVHWLCSLYLSELAMGSVDVAFRTPLAPYEKSKFLGSGGSLVARLKLKGIDGRAPPGVEHAA
ncbi:hypothetical protein AgCh_033899 [Apium graveolens]